MTSISLAEYHDRYAPKAKSKSGPSKYKAQRIEKDGMKFDSVKEYKRYIELTARMQRGEISELQCQVKFELAPKVKIAGEKRAKPALRYFADFTYIENGVQVVEDVKSAVTRKLASYRNKKHLMKTVHDIDIREV
ncbi:MULTISPECIES: DUF1064 domain-containing protein [Acinetobacter]|uniref:DUF1064 domain-containing protein n=1 Tax=Acinetobacter chengduensis TaxID=2420890 RepID=A0ABX9TST3_9GAMM|nr:MULTISPECIES: DUF1064 domain-containing protein [Acinetobacter]RKG37851.1 DUF1064 domain-containing protein [Acinetobacter sp. WCHAc060007]RLL17566.1 DUF1064 domain-containing protein [Acinetobacter chengduensis]